MSRRTLIAAACVLLALGAAVFWFVSLPEGASPRTPAGVPTASHAAARATPPARASKWRSLTDDRLPGHQRLELARAISPSVSSDDVPTLFALLDHNPPAGLERDWYLVLNEIMERMRRYGIGADTYSARLGSIIADGSRDEVVRDYAIQHLVLWTAPGNPGQVPHESEPAAVVRNLGLIAGSVSDPSLSHTTLPGTALLALADATRNLPRDLSAPAWNSLETWLSGLLSGEISAQPSTRVSAIQAVALVDQRQYLPLIRAFAADEATEPSVRLSSIASLGFYASPDDRNLLERIAAQNTRYRFAATSALERLTDN